MSTPASSSSPLNPGVNPHTVVRTWIEALRSSSTARPSVPLTGNVVLSYIASVMQAEGSPSDNLRHACDTLRALCSAAEIISDSEGPGVDDPRIQAVANVYVWLADVVETNVRFFSPDLEAFIRSLPDIATTLRGHNDALQEDRRVDLNSFLQSIAQGLYLKRSNISNSTLMSDGSIDPKLLAEPTEEDFSSDDSSFIEDGSTHQSSSPVQHQVYSSEPYSVRIRVRV